MNFDDLDWHDTVIRSIHLDRANPGYQDTIEFELEWPDRSQHKLLFTGVYQATIKLNFGVVTPETIDRACVFENHPMIDALQIHWKGYINDIKLSCYEIHTCSTGGQLNILATGFSLELL